MSFIDDIGETVYMEYRQIAPQEYRSKIRFYEQNKKLIPSLPYEMRLEMSLEYVVALFEVGEYYSYLKHVDKLLARVIEDNIFSIDGDDIYQELLYRKAASLHNVVDYYGAEHVLNALCKIDKENDLYKKTYLKNNIDRLRYNGQKTRAIVIAMFLLSGLLIGVELLIIRPFYPDLVGLVEMSRNILFGSAVAVSVIQELKIRITSLLKYRNLVRS